MSGKKHFEIIVSGRQLAVFLGTLAAVLLLAFALGIGVGLLEPRARVAPRQEAELVAHPGEPAGGGAVSQPPVSVAPSDQAGRGAAAPSAAPERSPTPAPTLAPVEASTPTPAATAPPQPTEEAGLRASSSGLQAPGSGVRAESPEPRAPGAESRTPRSTPRTLSLKPQAWIQVAALTHRELADGVRQRVMALGFRPEQVAVIAGADGKFRVRLGPFPDDESAGRVTARLHAQGFADAFPVKE